MKYKAISTGYGSHGFPQQEGVILLDLKRMNRIIEMDAKNKFAVVEPYVVWAQLEAEALKRGLFTTPIQAGSQASVLANVTSGWGMNVMGNHGGHNGRNCLGVEWVLPTGELLRLGPEEAWFCGDGPGPSLRGIMRGHCGAQGGMGVFTKVGIKLHHWPGPPELPTETGGLLTGYRLKQSPDNAKVITPSFRDYDSMTEFLYLLGQAEIGYAIFRAGEPDHFLSIMAGAQSNKTVKEWHESGLVAEAVKQYAPPAQRLPLRAERGRAGLSGKGSHACPGGIRRVDSRIHPESDVRGHAKQRVDPDPRSERYPFHPSWRGLRDRRRISGNPGLGHKTHGAIRWSG